MKNNSSKVIGKKTQKYTVTFYYQAAKVVHVTAESPEEAHEKAVGESHASICHQCGGELELNDDPIRMEVEDENGAIVLDDGD